MLACLPFVFAPLIASAASLHTPHDDVHDIAIAPLAGGGYEIVVVSNDSAKVQRSRDGGLSWEPIGGGDLELYRHKRVAYWPGGATPGSERFFIGTEEGVWSYSPVTGLAEASSGGLPPSDVDVADLASSAERPGAVFLLTTQGNVYRWSEGGATWQPLLATGQLDDFGKIAVSPAFDADAAPGLRRRVLATGNGVLYESRDGGASWEKHAQFATPAQLPTDWRITALSFEPGHATSGRVLLGRGRENPAAQFESDGEVWVADADGSHFARTAVVSSSVRAITSTVDASGGITSFVALEHLPALADQGAAPGVLKSIDSGRTWTDFGNHQDFYLEPEVGTNVPAHFKPLFGLAAAADYATSGVAFLGRPEGLYRTTDGGVSWRQLGFRPALQMRDLSATLGPNGERLIFGGSYGSGLLELDMDSGEITVRDEMKMAYLYPVSASPNYALDGTVFVGGTGGLAMWADPTRPPANPFGATGWLFTETNPFGFIKTMAISPWYDGSATTANFDQSLVFSKKFGTSTLKSITFRTLDGGRNVEVIDGLVGGGDGPWFRDIDFSPTYDDGTPGGRTDVYASANFDFFRLDDTEWNLLASFGVGVREVAVDPSFSRPANPRVFAALGEHPYLVEILDHPGGPVVTEWDVPGLQGEIRELLAPPDFAVRPVLYVATWALGVFRIDFAAPSPQWEPVGGPWPRAWATSMRLAPDFVQSREIVVGTQGGFVVGRDQPGAPWVELVAPYTLDDEAPEFTWFAPNDPANPDPSRAWAWTELPATQVRQGFGTPAVGSTVQQALHDGSALEWTGWARNLALRSFRGPSFGRVRLSATDVDSGAVLATQLFDLDHASHEAVRLELNLATRAKVRFRAEALLSAGQSVVVDALSLED